MKFFTVVKKKHDTNVRAERLYNLVCQKKKELENETILGVLTTVTTTTTAAAAVFGYEMRIYIHQFKIKDMSMWMRVEKPVALSKTL